MTIATDTIERVLRPGPSVNPGREELRRLGALPDVVGSGWESSVLLSREGASELAEFLSALLGAIEHHHPIAHAAVMANVRAFFAAPAPSREEPPATPPRTRKR